MPGVVLQWQCLPLLDNYTDDKYLYEVHVYTGLKGSSSTDSKVMFIVNGSHIGTGIRKMEDGIRKVWG